MENKTASEYKDKENDILTLLYDNLNNKPLTSIKISHELKLKNNIVETYLIRLEQEKLITHSSKKSQAVKSKPISLPAKSYNVYLLTSDGIKYVENGFNSDKSEQANNISNIFAKQAYFGTVFNTNIDIEQMVIQQVNDESIIKEINNYMEELKNEIKNEVIHKSKIKDTLRKIASKGFEEITNAAITFAIKEILGL